MMFDPAEIETLRKSLDTLAKGFSDLPDFGPDHDYAAIGAVLNEAAKKMQENFPYHHPLYAGQMLKPPHAVARLGDAMSL